MKTQFEYSNDLEKEYIELRQIRYLVDCYLENIKCQDRIINHKDVGELFGYDIAFRLERYIEPPITDEYNNKIRNWVETIELQQIQIKRNQIEIPTEYPRYNFRKRIKILFKGHI